MFERLRERIRPLKKVEFETASQWIDALFALSRVSAQTPDELRAWYGQAIPLSKARIREQARVEVPEVIWHYLADADIRAREPEYREGQTRAFEEAIQRMKGALGG